MHIVITSAGKRTEHWTSLFASLCRRPDITLTVLAADITDLTDRDLSRYSRECGRLHYHRPARRVRRPARAAQEDPGAAERGRVARLRPARRRRRQHAGLAFPAGGVAALADRLARPRDNPDLARRLSTRGLARSTGYSWDRIAAQLCQVRAGLARSAAPAMPQEQQSTPGYRTTRGRLAADPARPEDPRHPSGDGSSSQRPAPHPWFRRIERR